MSDMAKDRYEVEVVAASGIGKGWRVLVTLVANWFAMGGAIANPGGRQAVIRDRATGAALARVDEPMGDDDVAMFAALESDLATLSAADFHRQWIALDD